MKKLKKIVKTVLIFLVVMFVICLIFSLYKLFNNEITISELLNETFLYFLYTVGYGALEGDSAIQNILAIIGIVSLALMTTYLTINLFWRLDDVKFNKVIVYDNKHLKMEFKNNGRDICDMKASFILYNAITSENISEPKEYYMPLLPKGGKWKLNFDLNETFWYKAVYDLLTTKDIKLYCTFSFVDTSTGQSSIKVENITRDNFKITDKLLEYEDFIKPTIFKFTDLMPIENKGKLNLTKNEDFAFMDYSFDALANENSFVMAYYNFHEPLLNLEKYNKETTYFEVKFTTEDKIKLNFEIKTTNNIITKYIELNNETKLIKLELKDFAGDLEEVKEICYTIFKESNNLSGKLGIGNLRIVTR